MPKGSETPNGLKPVIFTPGIVKALRARALEAFYSLPRRGAEIGGLLMGAVLQAEPLEACITGFEEIPCQHRYGPSYVLVEEDIPQLQAALQRERPDPVIGFFRSYTGREMVSDEADRNLLERFLPNAPILLLLQPGRPAACAATFLFPEKGAIASAPQYPSFDFAEERLAREAPEDGVAPTESPSTAEQVAAAPESVVTPWPIAPTEPADASPMLAGKEPVPPDPPRAEPVLQPGSAIRLLPQPPRRRGQTEEVSPQRKRHWSVPLIAAILLCGAAAGLYELWTLAQAPRWAPLGLDAQTADEAIHLAWDKNLRLVRDAGSGVLAINDGSASKQVELTADQVRGGSYDYRPTAADVLFRLELFGSGVQTVGDSLRVVTAPAAKPPVPQAAPPPPTGTGADSEADRQVPRSTTPDVAVAPKPLREIYPEIPEGIRARIHGRVVVPVEVHVTAKGGVTSATPHGSGDDIYGYLSIHAAQAARRWRFSPARARSGEAAAASRIVYFVFTGPES